MTVYRVEATRAKTGGNPGRLVRRRPAGYGGQVAWVTASAVALRAMAGQVAWVTASAVALRAMAGYGS